MPRAAARLVLALGLVLCLRPGAVRAQSVGSEFVTFWRGELRIFATQPDTTIALYDLSTGLLLDPATWTGNFSTNPFTLANVGDSFEGDSASATIRVRIRAYGPLGPTDGRPVVAWTGWIAAGMHHPAAPPPDQNSWASYIPDVQTGIGGSVGSELGLTFLGFSSRDMWIVAQKGPVPVAVTVEDLVTNTDSDSDDNLTLDRTSPYLIHEDAEIEVYAYHAFEDDTIRVTSNVPSTVLVGMVTTGQPDWEVTPPSFAPGDRGRELGTLFYLFDARWLTIMPIEDNTSITVEDLTDGDDTYSDFLPAGDRANSSYDIYVSDPTSRTPGEVATPRPGGPAVTFHIPPGGAIDDDLIKVTASRPVLVLAGPIASDTNEFADVAYSVPTGPTSQLIMCYVQNGGANDIQLFSFSDTNNIRMTSLTYTSAFGTGFSDFSIPTPTPWEGGNVTTGDWFWSTGACGGELLRIESDQPVQVMSGDYDGENYGAFIPFVAFRATVPPRADAGPDLAACPGVLMTIDGSSCVDGDGFPGPFAPAWQWDLDIAVDTNGDTVPDDDVDDVMPVVSRPFPPGVHVVKLTYWDDEGEIDVDYVTVSAIDAGPPLLSCPPTLNAVATSFSGGYATLSATASDDCDSPPVTTNDRTAGGLDASDTYPCGHTAVTFTTRDSVGNVVTCVTDVAIDPVGTLAPVGGALRERKVPAELPELDWSRMGPMDPDARIVVLRSLSPSAGWVAAPGAEALTGTTWVDAAASETLIFYDVRTVICDGSYSAD